MPVNSKKPCPVPQYRGDFSAGPGVRAGGGQGAVHDSSGCQRSHPSADGSQGWRGGYGMHPIPSPMHRSFPVNINKDCRQVAVSPSGGIAVQAAVCVLPLGGVSASGGRRQAPFLFSDGPVSPAGRSGTWNPFQDSRSLSSQARAEPDLRRTGHTGFDGRDIFTSAGITFFSAPSSRAGKIVIDNLQLLL